MPKSGGPRVREKGKKITSRAFLTKAILAIRDKIRRTEIVRYAVGALRHLSFS